MPDPPAESFGALVSNRLDVLKKSQRWLATKIGVSATLLNWAIQEKRPLTNRADVLNIAAALGIDADRLLRAANLDSATMAIDEVGTALTARLGPAHVEVVTDPRFLDSALFVTICAAQPLAAMDVSFEIVPTSWASVADTLAARDMGVGFYNRKLLTSRGLQARVQYWTDLTLYRGYAVLAKPSAPVRSDAPVAARLHYVRQLLEAKEQLHIITIGGDTSAVLDSWFFRELNIPENRMDIEAVVDADFALDVFLKDASYGDLFIGGLPQRVRGRMAGCEEVLTSEDDPLLFSFNSLICTEEMLGRRDILYLLHGVWGDVVQRLYEDLSFRRTVAQDCDRVLRKLGIMPSRMSFSIEAFVQLFGGDPEVADDAGLQVLGRNSELFLRNAAELTDTYLTIVETAIAKRVERLQHRGEANADAVWRATQQVIADVRAAESEGIARSNGSASPRSPDRAAIGAP